MKHIRSILIIAVLLAAGCSKAKDTELRFGPHGSTEALMSEFYKAVTEGPPEQVRALLEDNPGVLADMEAMFGESLIHSAASAARADVIPILVEAGSDVNSVNSYGKTPLHGAMSGNFLHPERASKQKDVVAALLAAGADVNAEDEDGRTPFDYARIYRHDKIAAMLAEAGATDPTAKTVGECPNGHTDLRDVPVSYGAYFTRNEEMDRKIRDREIILGGCVPTATKHKVVCMTCDFRLDPVWKRWRKSSDDRPSFGQPFPDVVTEMPLPADASPSYIMFIAQGTVRQIDMHFTTLDSVDELTPTLAQHLTDQGFEFEESRKGFPPGIDIGFVSQRGSTQLRLGLTEYTHDDVRKTSVRLEIKHK